jgi:hypothetical protein
MTYNEVEMSYYTMTPAALVGLYLVLTSIAIGPNALGLALLQIARLRAHIKSPILIHSLTWMIAASKSYIYAFCNFVFIILHRFSYVILFP